MASMCYNERKKLEFIKNPVIAEFLGMASNTDFTESDLENSILSNRFENAENYTSGCRSDGYVYSDV